MPNVDSARQRYVEEWDRLLRRLAYSVHGTLAATSLGATVTDGMFAVALEELQANTLGTPGHHTEASKMSALPPELQQSEQDPEADPDPSYSLALPLETNTHPEPGDMEWALAEAQDEASLSPAGEPTETLQARIREDLPWAYMRGELEVWYQPIVSFATSAVSALEA